MGGIASILTGQSPKGVDMAAQAAAQQAAREAEQAKQLAADRADALAAADEARAAESTRLKKLKSVSASLPTGTGQLAQTEAAGLKSKLG